MGIEIRAIDRHELEPFLATIGFAFHFDWKDEDRDFFTRHLELDRTVAAIDGDEIVGTAGAFSLQLTVPGADVPVPTGGTTIVAVRPTHRRRGLLRRMMDFHLDEVRERGEPLAALWASDSGIYTRFGYGLATHRLELEVDKDHVDFAGDPPPGRVDLVPSDDVLPALRTVYDPVAATRPGMFARAEDWWQRVLVDPESWREGYSAKRYAVYSEDGEALGYAVYRAKEKWERGHGAGSVRVAELVTATPAARAGLWRYLCGHDLVAELTAWNSPVDEILPWLVANPRRVHAKLTDAMWVRLMDVPEALGARRYRVPGRLVFEVGGAADIAGVYELDAGPDGAECKPSEDEPELRLDAGALGAAYLGGSSLRVLADAGRVAAPPDVIGHADAMFGWHEPPWCQEVF